MRTCIEFDEEMLQKVKKSGVTLRYLVKMGLNHIENNKEKNEDIQNMEKNIAVLVRKVQTLGQENLFLHSKIQEIGRKSSSETVPGKKEKKND